MGKQNVQAEKVYWRLVVASMRSCWDWETSPCSIGSEKFDHIFNHLIINSGNKNEIDKGLGDGRQHGVSNNLLG